MLCVDGSPLVPRRVNYTQAIRLEVWIVISHKTQEWPKVYSKLTVEHSCIHTFHLHLFDTGNRNSETFSQLWQKLKHSMISESFITRDQKALRPISKIYLDCRFLYNDQAYTKNWFFSPSTNNVVWEWTSPFISLIQSPSVCLDLVDPRKETPPPAPGPDLLWLSPHA